MAQESSIEFYGASWCGDCRRAKSVLDKLGVAYSYHDLEQDEGAADQAVAISGQQHIPVLQFTDGTVFVEPSNSQLEAKVKELGLA